MPVYVGTDANISYQGTPRVENPNRDAGPLRAAPGRGSRSRAHAAADVPAAASAGLNLAPGGAAERHLPPAAAADASDPSPQEQVPPQGSSALARAVAPLAGRRRSSATGRRRSSSTSTRRTSRSASGQQQTVLVRATSPRQVSPAGRSRIRFDPVRRRASSRSGPSSTRDAAWPTRTSRAATSCSSSRTRRTSRARARSPRSRCAGSPPGTRDRCRSSRREMGGATVTVLDGGRRRPMIGRLAGRLARSAVSAGFTMVELAVVAAHDRDPRGHGRPGRALLRSGARRSSSCATSCARCARRSTSTSSSPTRA